MEDDWMNPQTASSYTHPKHRDGQFYLIERKRRIPVTGNVGFIERWDVWQEFDSKTARDNELARIREATTWHVRGRQAYYHNGEPMRTPDPTEYMDV